MNEKTKKIIYLLAFLASVGLFGFALYVVFFRTSPPASDINQPIATPGGTLPTAGEGTPTYTEPGTGQTNLPNPTDNLNVTPVTALTNGPVQHVSVSPTANAVNYYDENNGKFYRIDANGNVISLSDKSFPKVDTVTWNTGGEKAILEFPDGSNIIYDFDTEIQTTLPKHWEDFQFSPKTDQLIAKSIGLDLNNRYLVISNTDGSQIKAVQALGENANKFQVSWSPNDIVIGFANTSDNLAGGLNQRTIIPIGKNQENLKGLTIEGRDFEPLWSPSGDSLLYSVHSDYSQERPRLWLVQGRAGSIGDNRKDIGLNTWSDKCTFASQDLIYCAVPKNLPNNAAMIRQKYRFTPDELYSIDVKTGVTKLITSFTEPTVMENLMLGDDKSTLFFQNPSTDLLEKIDL